MLKRIVREFLSFAKWEQQGIVVLLLLIVIVCCIQFFYQPNPVKYHFKDFSKEIELFEQRVDDESSYDYPQFGNNSRGLDVYRRKADSLFLFDPNTASLGDFCKMGFSQKQAEVILHYRIKGGRFKSETDFNKMYVVSDSMFYRLLPYIRIGKVGKDTVSTKVLKKRIVMVDLNTADTTALNNLKGVGASIAQRIIAYRDKLGGFARLEQVKEVYGIDSVRFEMFRGQLSPLSPWAQIKINSVSYESLRQHPYLNAYLARNIVYYRMKKGSITNIQQLVSERIISKECSEKLKDYIDYSN